MLEGLDQIKKELLRQIVLQDSLGQRDENRVTALACIQLFHSTTPPRKQLKAPRRVVELVAEVIGPAAERIDVKKVLLKLLRKQKAGDVEILVVMCRKPPGVGQRFIKCPRRTVGPKLLDELDWWQEALHDMP